MPADEMAAVEEIFGAVRLLAEPGSVVELRALGTRQGTLSGYFNDLEALTQAAAELSGKAEGVYLTLNVVNPELLARAQNRIVVRPKHTTSDPDILRRRWLPLDFDPIRPAGISSTVAEHRAAVARTRQCKQWLIGLGWPEPIEADSGNGAHLLFRIDLPNDPSSLELVRRSIQAVAIRFADEQVEVDLKTHNASRIWKTFGTMACKGESTEERPHRLARIEAAPADLRVVEPKLLEALAATIPEPSRSTRGSTALDVGRWLSEHGIQVEREGPWNGGGRKYILAECPLNPEHRLSAFVVQFTSGAIAAGCLHNSCHELTWQSLREKYDPRRPAPAVAPNDVAGVAPEFSEDALALTFTERHRNELRYTAKWGAWHRWDGTRWREDQTHNVYDLARFVCRETSAKSEHTGEAKRLAAARTVAAVERLAQADRAHAATVEQWDSDPWILATPGGIVDLRTGKLSPADPAKHCTKITAAAPACKLPERWFEFLHYVTAGNVELVEFLQRIFGYCLTGSTRELALFFMHGPGQNGKTKFVEALAGVMGDYAVASPMEAFTINKNERHPTEIARLCGARLVTAAETQDGKRWDEARIKLLTGGDPISAHFMRRDDFTFVPQFKLLLFGNHKPSLRAVDEAMRARFNFIPFSITVPPEERDRRLGEKLRAEWPGILQWGIEGCLHWQRLGLKPPAVVAEATEEYFASEDGTGRWIEECCVPDTATFTASAALFASWKMWAESAREFVGSQKRFSESLLNRGFQKMKLAGGVRGFRGLRLKLDSTAGLKKDWVKNKEAADEDKEPIQ